MSKTIEALKLAEEAFNYRCTPMSNYSVQTSIDKEKKALAAIREALAEQDKQEPVAWVDAKEEGYEFYGISYLPVGKHHLYAAPVSAEDIRSEALEEAAKVCESTYPTYESDQLPCFDTPAECAAAIRGLK